MIKTLTISISVLFFLFFNEAIGQNHSKVKTFKVHIGANALMCPNLGPKLKTNAEQIGAKVVLFDKKEDIMLLEVDEENTKVANTSYIIKLVQLTGYPDELITVKEIDEEEKQTLLKLKNK